MPDKNFENNCTPLVTIGMPAYNAKNFVVRAIDSLLAQTFKEFELIISDNCSIDGTWELLQEYAIRDNRIRLHKQDHNIGIVQNFKYLVSMAKCKYFMWAACDDIWYPDFIGSMIQSLESCPSCCVAMSAIERMDETGKFIDTVRFRGKWDPNTASYLSMINGTISFNKYNYFIYGLFRRNILNKVIHMLYEIPLCDRVFIIQLAMAYKFCYVDQVLHSRTIHSLDSKQRLPHEKINKMRKELFINFKVLYSFMKSIIVSPVISLKKNVISHMSPQGLRYCSQLRKLRKY
jgi:glycosyltransferase involved in cell wall biosynthesis